MKKYVRITDGEHKGKIGIVSRELNDGFIEVFVDLDGDPATPPIPIKVPMKYAKVLYWMNMILGLFFNWLNNRKNESNNQQ